VKEFTVKVFGTQLEKKPLSAYEQTEISQVINIKALLEAIPWDY